MRRQKTYILMLAFYFGLGAMAQPAHAVACFADRVCLPGHQTGQGHGGQHHDHDQSKSDSGHTCLCLQWRMGLMNGTSCTHALKAATVLTPAYPLTIDNGRVLKADLVDLMDIDPWPRRHHRGGGDTLPLQCPLYLQSLAILC